MGKVKLGNNTIPANLVNPEIGVTNKEANKQPNLWGRGTEACKKTHLCFIILGTQSKAVLPQFVLNMHVVWPK